MSPHLAAYGDSTAHTPNLDRLAAEGVRYTNVFSVSGVCAPSRSALISGMYPTYMGTDNMRTMPVTDDTDLEAYRAVIPAEIRLYPEMLRAAGWYTTNNSKEDYQFDAPPTVWDESSPRAHWRNRPVGAPFFAIFNAMVTHESQIWARKDCTLYVQPDQVPVPPLYPDNPVIRQDLARNYSNIVELDRFVGERLREVEEAGLLDSTIIFFYTDHGSGQAYYKREVYDRGLRVPMIIRFPGKKNAGSTDDRLISFVDLAPTVLSLAGLPVPDWMQGQAFLGPQTAAPRRYIYAARDRMDSEYDMVRTVHDGRYQYVRNFQPEKPNLQNIAYRENMPMMREMLRLHRAGQLNPEAERWFQTKPEEELYDYQEDPFEQHNLATDPAYAEKRAELRGALYRWMFATGDKGFIPEKELREMMWPNGRQPVTAAPTFAQEDGRWTLTCATPGASIAYRPTGEARWRVYQQPFAAAEPAAWEAVALRIGYTLSDTTRFR
ncbi:Arylsulfatase A [Catalinimonas alkaloidigena]|uniref:Arylsulfatase A n=2 Tax=Catalinimonas alkaloidigena TaxID=1075417 RepID=A0A1G9KX18_9BACT|nr:Arylsulfatase A [Catalinimonas alkaloidigena]